MSVEKILASWTKRDFSPVYWLEGEEDYYIDHLMAYAEHHILPESESAFNLTIFYGRDAEWASVINACRRYPMFADRQVVLLKEAQQMKDIEKLESYIEAPLRSTIFIIGYKTKTFDKRTKLSKTLDKHAEVFRSQKIREEKLNGWIKDYVASKGFAITDKSVVLLEEHIGNDLNRIVNEIEKLAINITGRKSIAEDDIERYIGISKEYNAFELMKTIAEKNLTGSLRIINYFENNPKAGPIQMVLPALYSKISKVYGILGNADLSEKGLKPHFYFNSSAVKEAQALIQNYGAEGIENMILLLQHYNLKAVGVGDDGTKDASLMKEMLAKMML